MIDYNLLEKFKNVFPMDKELLIFNIGTIKANYDSIAPLIGTKLIENRIEDYDIIVLGNSYDNIHALNIKEYIEQVKKHYPDKYIIATDASLTFDLTKLGKILISNISVKPGAGVGKDLPRIGDSSILLNTAYSEPGTLRISREISQEDIDMLAENIADTLLEFAKISYYIKNIDKGEINI